MICAASGISVFPASAGMSRRTDANRAHDYRFPRQRGDEPSSVKDQLDRIERFPRQRGDEPVPVFLAGKDKPFSPPARG